MAMAASGRRRTTEELSVSSKDKGTRGKYHVDGKGTDDSIDKSSEWSGKDVEEFESEEEAKTAAGVGRARRTLLETAG